MATIDQRIDKLEAQMQELRTETVYKNYGAHAASAYPSLQGYGGFFSIEGLYMKFFEGGTDYAFQDTTSFASTNFVGTLKYLDFDWRFAFRVTAGYQFDSPDWDLWAEYMRFQTKQKRTSKLPDGGSLYNNEVLSALSTQVLSSIKMNINFNIVDLNLGRPYFLRKTFSVHPFVGARGAWIHQNQTVIVDSVAVSLLKIKQHNDYNGVGLRSGSQFRWHFDPHWSFFGSLAGSLMWGEFDNSRVEYATAASDQIKDFNLNLDTRRILPNMSADAGLTWEQSFRCDKHRVRLTLGYEFDYWWRQNQTIHLDANSATTYYRFAEDLGLHGIKLNAALDF
jgi:hypothetical protein